MTLLTSIRRALPATSLFVAFGSSQTCYFPDGATVSTDIACNSTAAASSCCPADSFCLDNGLCFGDGIVSRSSCTDSTWADEACASYCTTGEILSGMVCPGCKADTVAASESADTAIAVTPCSSSANTSTFVCGLNNTECQIDTSTFTMSGSSGLVLRPSQIAALVEPALEATTAATASASQVTVTAYPSSTSTSQSTYSRGDMASLGCGLGLPLFFALCIALILLRREKQKYAPPKLMYKLPDDCKDEFTFRPPQRLGSSASSPASGANSTTVSSLRAFGPLGSQKPAHVQSFLERYRTMKEKGQVQEMDLGKERHELESTPPYAAVYRHELAERMSK